MSSCGRSKRDVIIEGVNAEEMRYKKLEKIVKSISQYLSDDNEFILLVKEQIESLESNGIAQREWAEQKEFDEDATVAEMFDSLLISRFYGSLSIAMTLRAIDYELDQEDAIDVEARNALNEARIIVEAYLEEECEFLENNLKYTVVPIKDLVKIQLESGLIISQTVKKEVSMPKETFLNLTQEKKDNLFQAAYKLFINNKYEDVTIRDLVREANIPIGSFYRYFEDIDI